jgi:hypothetical protein
MGVTNEGRMELDDSLLSADSINAITFFFCSAFVATLS